MHRLSVLLLTSIGMAAMSCQITGVLPSEALPPVSAGAPEAAPEAAPPAPPDPSSEAGILAELRGRHTALADHELVSLARTIMDESARHAFDPALVMAVIHVESGGYHLAVSHVGAMGLMQLLPSTGEELAGKLDLPWHGPDTLFDPVVNVKLGVAYLRQLTDKYDSMPTALAAYNWGPGRIDRRIRRGASVPSRYIEQVMKAYDPDYTPAGKS